MIFTVFSCWWRWSCYSSCAWFWCLLGALPWQHTWFSWIWKSSLGHYYFRIWQIRKAKCCIYWTLVGWTIERFYCWHCGWTSSPCWQLNWRYDLNIIGYLATKKLCPFQFSHMQYLGSCIYIYIYTCLFILPCWWFNHLIITFTYSRLSCCYSCSYLEWFDQIHCLDQQCRQCHPKIFIHSIVYSKCNQE